jgi:hypothetical protein
MSLLLRLQVRQQSCALELPARSILLFFSKLRDFRNEVGLKHAIAAFFLIAILRCFHQQRLQFLSQFRALLSVCAPFADLNVAFEDGHSHLINCYSQNGSRGINKFVACLLSRASLWHGVSPA